MAKSTNEPEVPEADDDAAADEEAAAASAVVHAHIDPLDPQLNSSENVPNPIPTAENR